MDLEKHEEKKLASDLPLSHAFPFWEFLLCRILPSNLSGKWLDYRNYEMILTPKTWQLKRNDKLVAIKEWDLEEAYKKHFESD